MTTASSSTTSISAELELKLSLVRPALSGATSRVFGGPPDALARVYPEYLRVMHNVVVATVPLVDAALDRLAQLDPTTDHLVAPLTDYLAAHRDEEAGHDELVLADLAALGLPPTFVTDRPPNPIAVDLVGAQYYWIHHLHPVVLLGHILVFEGAPMRPEQVTDLQTRSGLPAAAFGSLRLHSTLDVDHGAHLRRLLDGLPVTPLQRAGLGQNALSSLRHAAALLDHVASLGD